MRPVLMRHALPRPVRQLVQRLYEDAKIRLALRTLRAAPPGYIPSADVIARLHRAWGNAGWAARSEYLDTMLSYAAQTAGPIVECGSGVTTFLLAAVAGRRAVEVVSLEHEPEWRDRVVRNLGGLPARVVLAPLRHGVDFDWYDSHDVPRGIALVICDGPPESTRGGRYGLLPILGSHLADSATILFDDANTDSGRLVLDKWTAHGWHVKRHGTFAIVSVGEPRHGAPPQRLSRVR
jgi:methyltransferase family protein